MQFSIICFLLVLQLFICAPNAQSAQRYCGKKLTEKVSQVCKNCLHADTKYKRHAFKSMYTHRRRRAINFLIPVCCLSPCTVSVMEEFCCTSEERQRHEEARKLSAF